MNRFFILAFLLFSNLYVIGQSKHLSLMRLGNYCFDFDSNPVSISELSDNLNNTQWYVDSNGVLRLIAYNKNGSVYNSNMELVSGTERKHVSLFVPKPGNSNLVYCFYENDYFVIDLTKNMVVDSVFGYMPYDVTNSFLAVHHSNCNDVWIVRFTNKRQLRFLLTSSGLKYEGETIIDTNNYKSNIDDVKQWCVRLSVDCQYYTAVLDCSRYMEVYFGNFNRSSGLFERVAQYEFPSKGYGYCGVMSSIFSYDNSKIYYSVRVDEEKLAYSIYEVILRDGVPDFDNCKKIYSYDPSSLRMWLQFYYGLDGIIYTMCPSRQNIGKIEIGSDGETIFTPSIRKLSERLSIDYFDCRVSSWFMQNPCEEYSDPCSNMKPPVIMWRRK